MLIEFCCPVCKAPLAIQKQEIGGQVNCPNCQKVILLPPESPLSRLDEDTPPYSPGQTRAVEDIAEAIHISVDPYRQDLENKSELLNDAVEMIKVRNERIKEIESLILETQKDLWELEVLYDERKQEYKKARAQTKELRGELHSKVTGELSNQEEVSELKDRVAELDEQNGELTRKKDMLKARLVNMIEHAETLDKEIKSYQSIMGAGSETVATIGNLANFMENQEKLLEGGNEDLLNAKSYLQKATKEIKRLHDLLAAKDRQRVDLEELVKSSSQDMKNALDDKAQWKKQAEALEKQNVELASRLEKAGTKFEDLAGTEQNKIQELQVQLEEALRIQSERDEDIGQLKLAKQDLEKNLEVLRNRQKKEQEKQHEHSEKKSALLASKLNETRTELEETEEKLSEALTNQEKLAQQSLQSEQQRKDLKKKLTAALEKLEALEG